MAVNPFDVLRGMSAGFRRQHGDALRAVNQARKAGDNAELATALRILGEHERRTPLLRKAALKHYEEAVALLRELDDPLKLGHTIRHLGLVHEDAGRLTEAEECYDEALSIYREHESADTLDYANAVRYPAAIKDRLGKHGESAALWEEAYWRYDAVGIADGAAEAAGRLTLFFLDKDETDTARDWFAKARNAAEKQGGSATERFIAGIAKRF